MEISIIAIYVVVFVLSCLGGAELGKLSRRQYRPKWEAYGRDDARRGCGRYDIETKWIQKFYDTGYDSVEKEKANV
jgi:hypothetical protein